MSSEITMTQAATEYFKKAIRHNPQAVGIRVSVVKSGCSGYRYKIEEVNVFSQSDKLFNQAGITLVVDDKSFAYLEGTEVDCVKQGFGDIIVFNNPNARAQCGCGESFQLKKQGS